MGEPGNGAALGSEPRAGVGGQEAALGSTGHGSLGPAGALPPHLLWEMALGAVKASGESLQLLPRAATSGSLGSALSLPSVCAGLGVEMSAARELVGARNSPVASGLNGLGEQRVGLKKGKH